MREKIISYVFMGYTLIEILLCVQFYKICKNPTKYDYIHGYKKYKNSKYFWPASIPYERYEFPHRIIPSTIWLAILIVFLYYFSQHYIHSIGSSFECLAFRFTGPYLMLLEVIVLFFTASASASHLAMHSRFPIDVCYTTVHLQGSEPRNRLWRKQTLQLIVLIAVLCSIHIYTISNGGYIDKSEMVYYRGFSNEQSIFRYSEIESCVINYDEFNGELLSYVIENTDGDRIDLIDNNISFVLEKGDSDYLEFIDGHISEAVKTYQATANIS